MPSVLPALIRDLVASPQVGRAPGVPAVTPGILFSSFTVPPSPPLPVVGEEGVRDGSRMFICDFYLFLFVTKPPPRNRKQGNKGGKRRRRGRMAEIEER